MSSNTAAAANPSAYAVLGVKSKATDEEIKGGYKKKVVEAHPDKPGGTTQKFRAVQKAYDQIKTAERRLVYNKTLNAVKKVKNYSSIRPKAWADVGDRVKHPMQYPLMDTVPYTFETAAEKMRSKYRHGDVVKGPKGDQGVIVGSAVDGIYWMKEADPFASLLFSPDFGGDRDIMLLFRDPKNTNGGYGNSSRMTQSQRDKQLKSDIADKAKKRRVVEQLRQVAADEDDSRHRIESAVRLYFSECKESMRSFKARHCTTAPVLAPGATLRWSKSASGTSPPPAGATTVSPRPEPVSPNEQTHVLNLNLSNVRPNFSASSSTDDVFDFSLPNNGRRTSRVSSRDDSGNATPESNSASLERKYSSTARPGYGGRTQRGGQTSRREGVGSSSGPLGGASTGRQSKEQTKEFVPNLKSFADTYTGPSNGGASASFRSTAPRIVNSDKPFAATPSDNPSGGMSSRAGSAVRRPKSTTGHTPQTTPGKARAPSTARSTSALRSTSTTRSTSLGSSTARTTSALRHSTSPTRTTSALRRTTAVETAPGSPSSPAGGERGSFRRMSSTSLRRTTTKTNDLAEGGGVQYRSTTPQPTRSPVEPAIVVNMPPGAQLKDVGGDGGTKERSTVAFSPEERFSRSKSATPGTKGTTTSSSPLFAGPTTRGRTGTSAFAPSTKSNGGVSSSFALPTRGRINNGASSPSLAATTSSVNLKSSSTGGATPQPSIRRVSSMAASRSAAYNSANGRELRDLESNKPTRGSSKGPSVVDRLAATSPGISTRTGAAMQHSEKRAAAKQHRAHTPGRASRGLGERRSDLQKVLADAKKQREGAYQ